MRSSVLRLPNRFPVGTRFVIEGREGRISSRYLEFPDGRQVKLPVKANLRSTLRRRRSPPRFVEGNLRKPDRSRSRAD